MTAPGARALTSAVDWLWRKASRSAPRTAMTHAGRGAATGGGGGVPPPSSPPDGSTRARSASPSMSAATADGGDGGGDALLVITAGGRDTARRRPRRPWRAAPKRGAAHKARWVERVSAPGGVGTKAMMPGDGDGGMTEGGNGPQVESSRGAGRSQREVRAGRSIVDPTFARNSLCVSPCLLSSCGVDSHLFLRHSMHFGS